MQTILGAGGVIGRELAGALRAHTDRIRLVSRRPRQLQPSDDVVAADLLDAGAASDAVRGSEVAYLVVGLPYSTQVWQEHWPRLVRNVVDACKRHGTRLVFFDNVYAYGLVRGPMTEDTPYDPVSRKGEVRAGIATMLEDEMSSGGLQAMIVRSADFYGPGATTAFTHTAVFERLRAGKTPQWVGDPKATHRFTYTPDAGRATAFLGQQPEAYGQVWHLPTSREPMSGETFVRLACEAVGRPYRLQAAPRAVLRLMGLVNPVIRENHEMLYQFEEDYRFDSSKIEKAFGLTATPYREGIATTVAEGRSTSARPVP